MPSPFARRHVGRIQRKQSRSRCRWPRSAPANRPRYPGHRCQSPSPPQSCRQSSPSPSPGPPGRCRRPPRCPEAASRPEPACPPSPLRNNRVRTVVLDLEHPGKSMNAASLSLSASVTVCTTPAGTRPRHSASASRCRRRCRCSPCQMLFDLRERHHTRRRGDPPDREVVGAARRAGDHVADLVEQNLRALPNAVAVCPSPSRRSHPAQTIPSRCLVGALSASE